jgi:hypothetical protein
MHPCIFKCRAAQSNSCTLRGGYLAPHYQPPSVASWQLIRHSHSLTRPTPWHFPTPASTHTRDALTFLLHCI